MGEPGTVVGKVAELWCYPVQSMRGEALDLAELTAACVVGDRAYGIVDPDLGEVVSSAQGRRKWRDIVTLGARFATAPTLDAPAPAVEILLPEGERLRSDQADIDTRLSAFLGAPVHLADKRAEAKRSAYDHSPLHLLTTASLKSFAAHHREGRFETARFRPNLLIDTDGAEGFLEQGWIERRFRIGDAVEVAITEHCKRCIMTTLPQGDLPMDPVILHTTSLLNATRAGVYAAVVRPGTVRIGDPVRAIG
jgi:MOSC domain-containing protein